MAIYTCAFCDRLVDDDYEPGTEYGSYLICEDCVIEITNEVENELSEDAVSQMKEEDILEWHRMNIG